MACLRDCRRGGSCTRPLPGPSPPWPQLPPPLRGRGLETSETSGTSGTSGQAEPRPLCPGSVECGWLRATGLAPSQQVSGPAQNAARPPRPGQVKGGLQPTGPQPPICFCGVDSSCPTRREKQGPLVASAQRLSQVQSVTCQQVGEGVSETTEPVTLEAGTQRGQTTFPKPHSEVADCPHSAEHRALHVPHTVHCTGPSPGREGVKAPPPHQPGSRLP